MAPFRLFPSASAPAPASMQTYRGNASAPNGMSAQQQHQQQQATPGQPGQAQRGASGSTGGGGGYFMQAQGRSGGAAVGGAGGMSQGQGQGQSQTQSQSQAVGTIGGGGYAAGTPGRRIAGASGPPIRGP